MEPRINTGPYNAVTFITLGKKLQSRAERLIVSYLILGMLVGFAVGVFMAGVTHALTGWPEIIGAALCGLIGLIVGEERAFELKIRAQTILCLASIEESGRRI